MKRLTLSSVVALAMLSVPALAQCGDKEKAADSSAKLTAAQACDKSSCADKLASGECDKSKCEAKLASGECDPSKCDKAAKLASGECDESKCEAKLASGECDPSKCDKAASAKLVSAGGCDKGSCDKAAGCDKASCDKLAKGECTGSACWDGPKMKFRVAGETVSCPKNAEILSKAHDNAEIRFVVGDKVYSDRNEALSAMADVLNAHLKTMTTVRYAVGDECVGCPTAAKSLAAKSDQPMKYRVASFTFDNKEAAEKAAERARAAAEKVQWTMVVDGKNYTCEKSASMAAGDKPCEYKVGEAKTKCKATAKVMLAQARIDAARQAIASVAGAGETVATAVGS